MEKQEITPAPAPEYEIEPHVAGTLSYLVPPITGIVFFIIEKENKFVRFHSFQSILFGIIAYVIISLVSNIPYLSVFLRPLLSLGAFAMWGILMWKAYNKEEFELPFIGKIAKDQIFQK